MAVGAIAAAAGTAISLYAEEKRQKAQKRAAEAQAEAKRQQAFELLARSEINIERLKKEAELFRSRQTVAIAAGGADVGSGANLLVQEQLVSDLANSIANQRREARFKSEQLFRGADIDTNLAGDIQKAGNLSLLGGALSGAGQVASRSR